MALSERAWLDHWRDLSLDRRRTIGSNELGPDAVPVVRPHGPPTDLAASLQFNSHAQLGTGLTSPLPGSQLGQINGRDAKLDGERCHAASRQLAREGSEVGAHLYGSWPEVCAVRNWDRSIVHNAEVCKLRKLDAVKITSTRHLRRQARLRQLLESYEGGAAQLARDAGTPKSHISAMLSGDRGMGDELAAKLERVAYKVAGWMDQEEGSLQEPAPPAYAPSGLTLVDAVRRLAAELARADEVTREAVAPLLSKVATEPQQVDRLSKMIEALLSASLSVREGPGRQ